MRNGPRIYNLFPLLAGSIADWETHLSRVAGMGFDWVYLNPFHLPGFSGSLYAVKDYYRLHPLFEGSGPGSAEDKLRHFIEAADALGLRVMMDLVINHTSKDALLTAEHPEWFVHDADGSLHSPRAIDPADATRVTVWGDLAELDYAIRPERDAMIDYWRALVRHYRGLGFLGFRCDAAYQVPGEVWTALIQAAAEVGESHFFAETLGAKLEQIRQLHEAGFDYLFNSACWWDFRAPWLLEQYEDFRHIAPSIAFPESHDTERLAAELVSRGIDRPEAIEAHYRLRYLFAATFSAGVMMPMGYEYGWGQRLHVVETRPEHQEAPRFDLSGFIAAVNRMRAGHPTFNVEGPQARVTAPDSEPVGLVRTLEDGSRPVLTLLNPDVRESHGIDLTGLELAGIASSLHLPDGPGEGSAKAREGGNEHLEPLSFRIFQVLRWGGDAVLERPPSLRTRAATAVDEHPGTRSMHPTRNRTVIIENVHPELDDGRWPVKREVGDVIEVFADVFKEGHDKIAAVVRYREKQASAWREVPMTLVDPGLDRWKGAFRLERNTRYVYTVQAWMDHWETWHSEVSKKIAADQKVPVELEEGLQLVREALHRAQPADRVRLEQVIAEVNRAPDDASRAELLLSTMLRRILARCPDRRMAASYDRQLEVVVDRVRARFATWYALFPRSQGTEQGRSATFRELERRLPDIRRMGFDVCYLTPIHPIGRIHRKGPNNSLNPGPDAPGCPYAIGAAEGGHKSIHPELGTLEDFRRLVAACRAQEMELALDIAIQCSPDHPYVREHPEWFVFRPDGTIRYAENPPKKYQDIVNLSFYGDHREALWNELLSIFLFWIEQGVTIFRVDNPHTKPFEFWAWLIDEVQRRHPETIFLSEAFTRPKLMYGLAKLGFTNSYTYFTWRNFKPELIDYFTELTQTAVREYMRPNLHTNTPDINPVYLQTGGRPAHQVRLVLAATLSSAYGIYSGFELCEATPVPGKEEYLDSEKYQYKVWDWDRPGNIKEYISTINRIRRENPTLQEIENLRFYTAHDENILFYGKMTLDRSNIVFVAVNLDPFDVHESVIELPLDALEVPASETFEVEELISGKRHLWRGARHTVRLDPERNPAEIYRLTLWTRVDYREPCY